MSPKDKATELFLFMGAFQTWSNPDNSYDQRLRAKHCAMRVVHEIKKELDQKFQGFLSSDRENYWQEVEYHLKKI